MERANGTVNIRVRFCEQMKERADGVFIVGIFLVEDAFLIAADSSKIVKVTLGGNKGYKHTYIEVSKLLLLY